MVDFDFGFTFSLSLVVCHAKYYTYYQSSYLIFLGTLRLEYEYDIDYENDFFNPVWVL